jgi:hypothetical protein
LGGVGRWRLGGGFFVGTGFYLHDLVFARGWFCCASDFPAAIATADLVSDLIFILFDPCAGRPLLSLASAKESKGRSEKRGFLV